MRQLDSAPDNREIALLAHASRQQEHLRSRELEDKALPLRYAQGISRCANVPVHCISHKQKNESLQACAHKSADIPDISYIYIYIADIYIAIYIYSRYISRYTRRQAAQTAGTAGNGGKFHSSCLHEETAVKAKGKVHGAGGVFLYSTKCIEPQHRLTLNDRLDLLRAWWGNHGFIAIPLRMEPQGSGVLR